MIKVGQKVTFNQFHHMSGGGGSNGFVTGTVTYINAPHRYFTTEYEAGGRTWRMSFNFNDMIGIGQGGIVRRVK